VDAASRSLVKLYVCEVLPVSATVAPTSMGRSATVETASTSTVKPAGASMKAAAGIEPASPVKAAVATSETASPIAATGARPIPATGAIAIAAAAREARPSVVTAAIVAATVAPAIKTTTVAATVEAMEPWAGAYKHAAHKVVRAPIAIRRASIRVIGVVAVIAHRSWSQVTRADSHADNDLRVGRSRRCYQTNRE
jgi:hypothetical protein